MNNLVVSVASLLVGVVASIWVSRYYFKRTIDKSLTPFLQFASSLFDGVDPSVRESLKIAYKGTPVSELLEVQFLIANTGERPIRDLIAPLTMIVPTDCSLLDASILHVSPEGREVLITQDSRSVTFGFPLLNAKEFFITKLLLQGTAQPKDFRFTVTVDDLPPVLQAVPLPRSLLDGEEKQGFEWGTLITGASFTVVGVALSSLIYFQRPALVTAWNQGIVATFSENWLVLMSCVVATIPTLILLVVGPVLCVGACGGFNTPKRHRFLVPEAFHRRRFLADLPHSAHFHALEAEAIYARERRRRSEHS